jgi:hypothetical protein
MLVKYHEKLYDKFKILHKYRKLAYKFTYMFVYIYDFKASVKKVTFSFSTL